MTALVAAFSLQDKIEQYGAYAGIAAVFGLGVLSLLYFAQAREVKRLRDWAGRAPERAAELEARVQADAQRRAAAQQATPAPSPAAPVTPAGQQPAPATGAAAPATAAAAAAGAAAATVAKPATGAPQNGTGSGTAVPPPGTEVKPGAAEAEKAGADAKDGNGNGKPSEKATPGAAPGSPAATPAAAAAAGPAAPVKPGAPGQPAAKPPAPAAVPAAATAAAAAGAASRPQPAAPLRAPAPAASVPPRSPAGAAPATTGEGRSRGRLAAMIGAGVAALVVVGVAAFLLFGGGNDNNPAPRANTLGQPGAANAAAAGQSTTTPAAKLVRKDFPLAVLNGTTVTGLARGAADKLTAKGYNEPNVVTNDPTNQTRAVTQVYFEPKARPAALDVAKILGVKAINVKPMDANARALADRATVEVFIGADKAQ